MLKRISAGITASFSAVISQLSLGGSRPPSHATGIDIASIKAHRNDDMHVELTGYLVRQIDPETYLFSDGKQHIHVEIDADDMPEQALSKNTRIKIFGECDAAPKDAAEIEVERIEVL